MENNSMNEESEHVYFLREDEIVTTIRAFEKLLATQALMDALIDEGVEYWEGYQRAIDKL
jgi:hypothetical protein